MYVCINMHVNLIKLYKVGSWDVIIPFSQSLACWINKKKRAWVHVMPSVGWKSSSAMDHASSDLSDHMNAPTFPSSSTQSGRTRKHGKAQKCSVLDGLSHNFSCSYPLGSMKFYGEGQAVIIRCGHVVLLTVLASKYTSCLSIWEVQEPYNEAKDTQLAVVGTVPLRR